MRADSALFYSVQGCSRKQGFHCCVFCRSCDSPEATIISKMIADVEHLPVRDTYAMRSGAFKEMGGGTHAAALLAPLS